MSALTRRQWQLVAVGVLVPAAALLLLRDGDPAAGRPAASNPSGIEGTPVPAGPVADVRLESLTGEQAALGKTERNPFRFQQRPAPAPTPAAPGPIAPPRITAPPLPSGPPPPPPIPLRYIGVVESPAPAGRIAMLSDGRGNVFYGKEGDIIEGRYRLLRVGPDSAELVYLDGRGRQTIRLSGQ